MPVDLTAILANWDAPEALERAETLRGRLPEGIRKARVTRLVKALKAIQPTPDEPEEGPEFTQDLYCDWAYEDSVFGLR